MAQNKHISIGRLGEDIAVGYLEKRHHTILARNYRKSWGELDIVTKKDGVLHFIEVKAGSWNKSTWPKDGSITYRPEDHMTYHKRARLSRIIETYLLEGGVDSEQEWTLDLIVVLLHLPSRKARIRVLKDILLHE